MLKFQSPWRREKGFTCLTPGPRSLVKSGSLDSGYHNPHPLKSSSFLIDTKSPDAPTRVNRPSQRIVGAWTEEKIETRHEST